MVFVGIVAWGIFIIMAIADWNLNHKYKNDSLGEAKEDKEPYYCDRKGRRYLTSNGKQVTLGVEFFTDPKTNKPMMRQALFYTDNPSVVAYRYYGTEQCRV